MKLGDAFSMAVPPNYDNPHLFFVISDPTKHDGTFIIVNLTGDLFRAGKECVLNIGDHPRITKESFIAFADAREITPELAQNLQKLNRQENYDAEKPDNRRSCQNRYSRKTFQGHTRKLEKIPLIFQSSPLLGACFARKSVNFVKIHE